MDCEMRTGSTRVMQPMMTADDCSTKDECLYENIRYRPKYNVPLKKKNYVYVILINYFSCTCIFIPVDNRELLYTDEQ